MSREHTEVLMPLMGEGITEATLVKWLKKPGEHVRQEEALLEVSTDKVDTEIPSPATGTLAAVFAADGDMVQVNAVIAHITAAGAEAAPSAPQAARTPPPAPPAPEASTAAAPRGADHTGRMPPAAATQTAAAVPLPPAPATAVQSGVASSPGPRAAATAHTQHAAAPVSPLARKIAKAQNIDLAAVVGTGLGGRITKRDLAGAAGQTAPQVGQHTTAQSAAAAGKPAARPAGQAHLEYGRLETRTDQGRELLDGVAVRREKMPRMRSLIADHMVRSVRTSPHVTTIFEIDMHEVVRARERHKAAFAAQEGFNLTFTPFFIHAAVQAIKQFPVVNVSVDGDDILWKDAINVGVAVAIDSGLIVPVIKNAGELNLLGIARRLNDLAHRARTKKLAPDDVQGGTFSITNPGMFGSLVSTPIINQPQVAILSIGAIIKRPVVIDDLIGVRPLVQIGLTFDHRVVDGEGGARYLAALQKHLQTPVGAIL